MSLYGEWSQRDGLPFFEYSADQEALPEAEWDPIQGPKTRRHWVLVGNRAIQIQVANDGRVALFDERFGQRWITAPDPAGTGISIIEEGDETWGSAWEIRPPQDVPLRRFGPTWFEVVASRRELSLERLILCPEGDVPWVLVRVRIRNTGASPRKIRHREEWAVVPRFANLLGSSESRRNHACAALAFDVETSSRGLLATERRLIGGEGSGLVIGPFSQVFGPQLDVGLEALGDTPAVPSHDGAPHPTLSLASELVLEPGATKELWFRFGTLDASKGASEPKDPSALLRSSLAQLRERLPSAHVEGCPEAEREVPWHAALLSGGACRDEVIGGYTLNQSSAYLFPIGFNGAARDPLQHALPLVYSEPDLALGVLRNTCAWSGAEGELPYALDGAKRPAALGFKPSDQNLWALALAAEYAAATGDCAAFEAELDYHPEYDASSVPLAENLRRQFEYFAKGVGRGEHGHVRMLNADWNDTAIPLSGVEPKLMTTEGESVLNSAMAAWVLPVYAGLCNRLGDKETASAARILGEELRTAVAREWNGRWFRRAYGPGAPPVGEEDCWLEVQPWALLCGAADADQARKVLAEIDQHLRGDSPLGARVRWPIFRDNDLMGGPGEGAGGGGIWFSINMTLIWAAAHVDPKLAWDEWRRMTLANHQSHYPAVWTGTLSGPDAYNGVESTRPGETWGSRALSMQANGMNNQHSHSQPLLSYLRLLGVEPLADGRLRIGAGASFRSRSFQLAADGHGWLEASGPVVLDTKFGEIRGGRGRVEW
ncbi:MAG: hypothetical protein JRG92_21040 [Deltaproteobacteria bacterium]|nr:hypothetical protein [Deltaproteobacteria bacterium]